MENFEDLLESYMDEEAINEKLNLIEETEEEDVQLISKNSDVSQYIEQAISIGEFMKDYLDIDIEDISFENLTHRDFKLLMQHNPMVIGISNEYVDNDEVSRGEILIVYDRYHNLGSYLNPKCLLKFLELDSIKKDFENLFKIRVSLSDIQKFYFDFLLKKKELEYLNTQCNQYYEILRKVKRTRSVKEVKKYVKEMERLK